MTKKKSVATVSPNENGTKEAILQPGPGVSPRIYLLNLINAKEGGPQRVRVTEEIMKFIELVASSRLNESFERVYKLEGLNFTVSEETADMKKAELEEKR